MLFWLQYSWTERSLCLRRKFQLKVMKDNKGQRNLGSLSVAAEVFHFNQVQITEICVPSLLVPQVTFFVALMVNS